jgi:hypothetical protein
MMDAVVGRGLRSRRQLSAVSGSLLLGSGQQCSIAVVRGE